MRGSSIRALLVPLIAREIGKFPGLHDGLSIEMLDLVGLLNDIRANDSSGSLSAVEDSISDSYKPSGCAPFSGACSKLLVETCIPLGDSR